ncbi:tetraacyldisaccharide 4'-kinase [Pseudoalteromonas sp. SWXJZ94C]|uniref:tetraacyldisaccharide 4'-kinase n=1 Tax=Pseudoalteromonas sp. SWXJZ94C TaxID=2792065 RepID=UPI0018CE437E|nr:tetraacyldisaccharide 4'-kinase [Pseudoalteromonas sp. SWXJZ94C]
MSRIEQSWYKPFSIITLLLLPLSALFWLISVLRKYFYAVGILKQFISKTPIIVVGNISVGGNGKTPFVLWLYKYLTQQGLSVGIISRGYGGRANHYPLLVTEQVDAIEAGDEPVLLYHRLKCPIAVGPNRQHNIELLEREYKLDVIISDDGMQHYKMARSIECCIVDSERRFGNGFLIPAGPLRETVKRLKSVDLIIENGGKNTSHYTLQVSPLKAVSDSLPLVNSITRAHSVSAIGNPKRFENSLEAQGITLLSTHHFRDHYAYTADDFIQFGDDNVLMTEKDAVKCKGFAKSNWYYLPVDAQPTDAVINKLNSLLKEKGILNGL